MHSLRSRLVALAAVAAFAGAACSGGRGGELGAARRDNTVPAKRVELGGIEGKQRGGNLRVAVAGLNGVDPAQANEASAAQMLVIDLLYDGLTRHDADDQGRITAGIATSWAVTNDGLLWEFNLDPEARFSTGQSIRSADVKASIERVVARGSASLSGAQLSPVKGYADFVSKRTPSLAGLKADNPAKLVVNLDAPFSSLPELLASPVFGIVAGIKDPNDGPITSSQFVVKERSPSRIALARGERADTRLDSIEIVIVKDAEAGLDAFANGDVDVAPIPAGSSPKLRGTAQVVAAPYGASFFYGLNVAAPGLDNAALRQAIVKAIDREALRAKYFADSADVMTGLIPPGVRGRRDNACGQPCGYDPAAAKELIKQALGGKPAPTLNVDYFDEPTGREAGVAKTIAESLTAAGLPAQARAHSYDNYRTFASSGRAELFRFGWIGTYPSPDAYIAPLFGSSATDNVFGLKDKDLDAAIVEARKSVDDQTRTTKYLAAEDRVLALMPLVPLVQYRSVFAVSGAVQGLVAGPQGSIDLSEVWIRP